MDYYKTTTDKSEVEVPEWAEEYDVGDTIHWEHDEIDGVGESEVVGFSTMFDIGYPVIDAPHAEMDGNHRVECVAITEKTVIKLVNHD